MTSTSFGGVIGAKANVEAVGEHQHLAGLEVGRDVVLVDLGLRSVGHEDHDHVSPRGGFGGRGHGQSRALRLSARLAGHGESDAHVDAAVLQVQSVRVSLRSVSDDGDLLGLYKGEVRIVVAVNLGHGKCVLLN